MAGLVLERKPFRQEFSQVQPVNRVIQSAKDQSEPETDDTEISFSFFHMGEETINLGIGESVDIHQSFDKENEEVTVVQLVDDEPANEVIDIDPAPGVINESDASNQENIEPMESKTSENNRHEIEDQPFILSLCIEGEEPVAEEENAVDSSIMGYLDKLKDIKISDKKINTDQIHIVTPIAPELDIEEVTDEINFVGDIVTLEQEYLEETTPVKEKIVEVDKVTTADRAGKSINWFAQNFIISPVKWIAKTAYSFLFNGFSFLGSLLKFLLVSAFITVVSYVLLTYVNPDFSAKESSLYTWDIMKELYVTISDDVKEGIKGS